MIMENYADYIEIGEDTLDEVDRYVWRINLLVKLEGLSIDGKGKSPLQVFAEQEEIRVRELIGDEEFERLCGKQG